MLIPTVISPELLVPAGGELDALREVACLCSHQRVLGAVKLCWLDLGDGYGYRAVCSQTCFTAHVSEGRA